MTDGSTTPDSKAAESVVVVMLALAMVLLAMMTFAAMAGFIALCDLVQVGR